jgi:transposase
MVSDTINRFKKTNSAKNLSRSGRPPALSPSDNRYLRLCALRDRHKSLAVLTEELNTSRKFHVSHTAFRRALHSRILYERVAAQKLQTNQSLNCSEIKEE